MWVKEEFYITKLTKNQTPIKMVTIPMMARGSKNTHFFYG